METVTSTIVVPTNCAFLNHMMGKKNKGCTVKPYTPFLFLFLNPDYALELRNEAFSCDKI